MSAQWCTRIPRESSTLSLSPTWCTLGARWVHAQWCTAIPRESPTLSLSPTCNPAVHSLHSCSPAVHSLHTCNPSVHSLYTYNPAVHSFTASYFANHLLTQDCYPAKPKGQVCPNPRAKRKPPTSNRVKNRTSLPRRIWTRGIWAIRRSPTMTARRSEQRPTLRPARSQEAPWPEVQATPHQPEQAWTRVNRQCGRPEPVLQPLGDWRWERVQDRGVQGPKDVDHKEYWSKNGMENTFYKISLISLK